MNPKLQKVISDIDKTNVKIKELQTLLPELEKQKIDLENIEIITAVRSAHIAPADFTEFVRTYKERLTANTNLNNQ